MELAKLSLSDKHLESFNRIASERAACHMNNFLMIFSIGHVSFIIWGFRSPDTLGSLLSLKYRHASAVKSLLNGPGHMTKMVAMPIYGKNLKKYSSPEPKGL